MPSLLDLLGQTWPARMAKSAYGAVTLPGDVYAGRVDPLSEEGIGRAADLGGLVMGGTFGGAPKGSIGSGFADPLWHGTPKQGLTHLEPSTRGPLGPGVYTSPAEQIAKGYAWEGGPLHQLPEKTRDIYRGHGHRSDAEWYGFKEDKARLLAAAEPEKKEAVSKILDKAWSNDGYSVYGNLRNLYKGDEGAQGLFKKAGFEGLSGLVDGPETLLFGRQELTPTKIGRQKYGGEE